MTTTTTARTAVRRMPRLAALVLAVALCIGWSASSAMATPIWSLISTSNSTVEPGGQLTFHVDMTNLGNADTDGSPYTLTATLPAGMTAVSVGDSFGVFACTDPVGASTIGCTATATAPHGFLTPLTFTVDVGAGASGVLTARFDVIGGGAPQPANTADPVTIAGGSPPFAIDAFDAQVIGDAAGTPYTQAAGHPYGAFVAYDVTTHTDPSSVVGGPQPVEPPKDVTVDTPPGFVGNPTGVDECTNGQLANTVGPIAQPFCPATSQIGTAVAIINGQPLANTVGPLPVYNMVPPPGVPARFGFNVAGVLVLLDAQVRTGGDYGLTVRARNIPEGLAIAGTRITLWGVPSDASHDFERACPGQVGPVGGGPTCTSGAPRKAFLRNPTSCTPAGVGLPTTLHIDSWFDPSDVKERTVFSHLTPAYPFAPTDWGAQQGPDGCDRVPFDPVLSGAPLTGPKAGEPSGFAFDVTIPQSDDPDVIAQADLKKAVVTLPEGVRVSPSSAAGLGACSSAQIALRSAALPTCPDASKIGTVTIDTPLLDQQVTGGIYLAKPFDNPFDSLVAVYLTASAKGVVIKLPGQVSMDPQTGQITSTFDDNPQLPFSRLHLEFKSGPHAPLTLPHRCTTLTTHAVLTGWNGRTVFSDSSFALTENAKGQPCPSKFTPGFDAGTKSNRAGSSSSFLLRFTREDDDQELSGVTVKLPSGLTGRIASAELCSDAAARALACPAGSKIGDVTVGAGAGTDPFFITNGRAYLTGPYKGAPFGVAIDVPAVAGPFDLGTVSVRSALFVDKHTAAVRIVSDPLPTILQGIPLDVRDVRVDVNKPGFFLNPTSCARKTIAATLRSTQGASANVSTDFQAFECANLGFKPRMVLRVGGRGHTHRGQTSPFSTSVTMPRGDANLRFVRVSLPSTINARLTVIEDACTRAEFESDIAKCAHARAGTASAVTPLLRDPLHGSVYFVKNGHAIPDLFVALRGQVDFDLIGRITIQRNKFLTTTFDAAPDVPIKSFTLRLLGDPKNGSVGAAANLCSAKSRRAKARLDYIGQNGKVRQVAQALKVAGCAKHRTHRHGR
jgi:uncharacterized repeat protein (TIGR01451 family)